MNGDAQLTQDGAIIGSPLYMSPEQGRGGTVDFSLGHVLSRLRALPHAVRPAAFNGPSPVGVISMHVTDKPAPVRLANPEVPEVLARIVGRMMAKDPAARFANYDDLLAALESARAERRELSGFARAGSLWRSTRFCWQWWVFRQAVGDSRGSWVLRSLPPPARANPGQVAARHSRRRCDGRSNFVEGGRASLPGLCWGPLLGQCWPWSSISFTATSGWPFAWPI